VSDPSDGCGFSSIRLHMSDFEAEIFGLNANKGPRNDGVFPSFVKLGADVLLSPVLHIFNLSLSTGTSLSKWKDSFLIYIFKTGKRNVVGNYLLRALVLQNLVSRDIFKMNYQVTSWTVWTPFVILGLFSAQSLISLHTLTL
jgi:hypothetical protein